MRNTVLAVTVIATLISTVTLGQEREAYPPGLESYVPNKLEWLALKLQAYYAYNNLAYDRFEITFLPKGRDTIMIVVHYMPDVDRGIMDAAVEAAREIIKMSADGSGWRWLKIEESYRRLD